MNKQKIRVKARAVAGSHVLGFTGTGKEQIGLRCEVLDGELKGESFTWYGFFTEAAEQRTLESLQIAGWDGTDFANLPGLGSTEFELQLVEEEDEHGELRLKANFINRIGVAMKEVMDASQKSSFVARINARMRSSQASGVAQNGSRGQHGQRFGGQRSQNRSQPAFDDAPMPGDDPFR